MNFLARFHRALAAGMTLLAVVVAPLGAVAAELLDAKPRIAVVSAFEPEWQVLKSGLAEARKHHVNGRSFITGKLAGKDVVLFLSGVSMVNAAMNTQIALDRFSLTAVIFSGIAGGVDPALHIGDVVIADQWGQYLEAVFARETSEGFAIPPWMQAQGFAGYGMIVPRTVGVTRENASGEVIPAADAVPISASPAPTRAIAAAAEETRAAAERRANSTTRSRSDRVAA